MQYLPIPQAALNPAADRTPPRLQARTLAASCPRLALLAERFDLFVIDIWGVLIDGQACLPGVTQALQGLLDMGKAAVLVTNSSRRAGEVSHMLGEMGLPCASGIPVLSSGELAYEAVCRDWLPAGLRIWVIGQQPGSRWIHTVGCAAAQGSEDADALFAWGLVDGDFESRLQPQLAASAARGLPMICSNPDRAVQIGGVRHLSAGTVAACYEQLGGKVQWFGKPDPQVFRQAVALAGPVPMDRVVVVGDSLDTDIAGAHAAGCAAVWVAAEGSTRPGGLPLHAVFRRFAC